MTTENQGPEERLLGDLADVDPGTQHMAGMMNRVHTANRRRRRTMQSSLVGGVAVIAAFLLLAIPMSYEVEVGNRLLVSWPESQVDTKAVDAALAELDGMAGRKIGFRKGEAHATLVMLDLPAAEARNSVRELLAGFLPADFEPVIESSPITRRVGGNALAALTSGSFKIMAQGMSDDEIEIAIIEELGIMGIRMAETEVSSLPDGSKTISIQMQESPYDSITFEVTF
jgi:hypothetical protein